MSQIGLFFVLKSIVKNIDNSPTNNDLREKNYDLRPHTFTFEGSKVAEIFVKAAKAQVNGPVSADDENFIRTSMSQYAQKIVAAGLKSPLNGRKIGSDGVEVNVITSTDIKVQPKGSDWRRYGKDAPQLVPDTVFNKVKEVYYDQLDLYFKGIQNYFAAQGQGTSPTRRKRKRAIRNDNGSVASSFSSVVSELGHEHGAGISETKIRDAIDAAYTEYEEMLRNFDIKSASELKRELEKLSFDMSVSRSDDGQGFNVSLEDKAGNRKVGMQQKKRADFFYRMCKQTIRNIGVKKMSEIKGSDSIVIRNRKLIIKAVADEFKKIPGAVVKTENVKLKKSTKAATKKIGKPNVKTDNRKKSQPSSNIGRRAVVAKRAQPTRPNFNLNAILGIVNAQLPERVAKNMVTPRLENRTGTFASSARVTDVTQTPQGYPSIGYTYEKNPYSVFESTSGSKFASSERDPRTLIDQSIREIVSQFGLGRLYTRRI